MSVLLLLLRNLVLTVIIECVLVLIFKKGLSTVYHCALVNMFTNPLVNIFLVAFAAFLPGLAGFYPAATALAEISAFSAEAVLYSRMGDFPLKKAAFVSLVLNACSFGTGLLL